MVKKRFKSVFKYLFESIVIFLIIALIILFGAFVISYYMGIEISFEGNISDQIELKVYKKDSNKVEVENDEPIDIYINNDLSIDDEDLIENKRTENDYFYSQLDDYGKIIYDKLVRNSENLKSGNYVVNFNNDFSEMLLNGEDEKLKTSYKNAVDCIRYDRMDMFYIDFTKMYLKIEKTTRGNDVSYNVYIEKGDDENNYFIEGIESQEQLEGILNQIEEKKKEILNNVSGTNYQKTLQIHDFLIDNLAYDETYSRANNDNLIGVFYDGNVVCEGYAKAFKYLLDGLEIPCILVIGDAVNSVGTSEKHMWNYVKINDEWYAVDVTWDDPILVGAATLSDESRYRYFCRKSDFKNNHFSDGVISVNGTEFMYPKLVDEQ